MRLIDLDRLGNPAAWHNKHVYFAEQIRMLPIVDAVPAPVKCGECEHYIPDVYLAKTFGLDGKCKLTDCYILENGYCNFGERKDDNHA